LGGLNAIGWKDLEKVILKFGFTLARTEGDHRAYVREDALRPVIIPTYDELPPFVIKKCLNTAGISRREFMKAIGREN
jgi:predicted RNA binding protein YcfA (HicA-like mRNA interferase family)